MLHKSSLTVRFVIFALMLLFLCMLSVGIFHTQGLSNPFKFLSAAALKTNNVAMVAATPLHTLDEAPIQKAKLQYIEIVTSCGPQYGDDCVVTHAGPGAQFDVKQKLRAGMVLRAETVLNELGEIWYKIIFDEWLRYEDRIEGDSYVYGGQVEVFFDEGIIESEEATPESTKKIIVDRSDQTLYAYENDELFMETSISTGLELTPTPRGLFHIFRKTPTRYMQGPLPTLPDKQVYDLPGVPWTMYFTTGGAAIHGTYWHDNFGHPHSHGCVNMTPADAKKLYVWASVGTNVLVRD
jgi:L,D-transpeptidase catalytic domain